jgi:hypothetical protein
MTHCFINTKSGFVTDVYRIKSFKGEHVTKARFHPDVRHALPFADLGSAHSAWSTTVYSKEYYCVLWPD